ncbi:hypothetical protein BDK51DRAFT_47436 [Blyttiomyces helicus]|uniref:Uncharacterized protein n=1 Tax=Blyttiomyces helicus TaxID=388810 RepID=A0A4P9W5N3_9FUNG|nr:hypothetical protein BDK51DRAFT_47436 [Blyttiomyces helicus]|eukprot:RKO86643.1 hypothetical protein BDK51DRAFT_47436 [Blyttiomyces helicus]
MQLIKLLSILTLASATTTAFSLPARAGERTLGKTEHIAKPSSHLPDHRPVHFTHPGRTLSRPRPALPKKFTHPGRKPTHRLATAARKHAGRVHASFGQGGRSHAHLKSVGRHVRNGASSVLTNAPNVISGVDSAAQTVPDVLNAAQAVSDYQKGSYTPGAYGGGAGADAGGVGDGSAVGNGNGTDTSF